MRAVVLAAIYFSIALISIATDTNGPPPSIRSAAEIETELRAVIAAEAKWLSAMAERLNRVRAVLDKKDLGFVPGAGPVQSDDEYTYLGALAKHRVALLDELLARRALETKQTPRHLVPTEQGHDEGTANTPWQSMPRSARQP